MKAILIDVANEKVELIDTVGRLQDWYALLNCTMVEAGLYFGNGDCIMVDEEALLKPVLAETKVFTIHGRPFIGNGLIVGIDIRTGDTVDCKLKVSEVCYKIKFYTMEKLKAKGV